MNRREFLGTAWAAAMIPASAWSLNAAWAADEIVLGAAVPVTGPFSLSGRLYYDALHLAEDDVNAKGGISGKKLKIVFEDTQSSNTGAVNAFVKLHQEYNPPLIFLSSYSTQNLATAPEVTKAQIPVFYAGGAEAVAQQKNKWMFRIRPDDGLAAIGMADYVKNGLKKSKPGVLYIQNDFGQGAANVVSKAFEKEGITVAGTEAYGQNDKDMSAQILSLKAKGADSLLIFCYPTDGALVTQQIKQLGVNVPVVGSSGLFLPTAINLLSQQDFENVWGVIDTVLDESRGERVKDFMSRYQKRFNRGADPYAACYYDSVMIAVEGITKVGPDPAKLRDYIAAVKDYQGVGHVYSFDAFGNGVHSVAVVDMKPGTKEIVLVKKIEPLQQ
jgi:branched-chain amino acid transport system substrate-binding protein